MPREHVDAHWERRLLPIVRDMVNAATSCPSAEDLTPNTDACNAYGGCPYRSRCGFTGFSVFNKTKEEGRSMGLMDRLKQKMAAETIAETIVETVATTVVDAVAAARDKIARGDLKWDDSGQVFDREGADAGYLLRAPTEAELVAFDRVPSKPVVATGVLPPDAPSRTSTPEEIEAAEAGAKKRGRPKKAAPTEKKMTLACPHCEEKIPVDEHPAHLQAHIDAGDDVSSPAPTPAPAVVETGRVDCTQPNITNPPRTDAPKIKPVIYVNCVFRKGAPEGLVLLEEWLNPIADLVAQCNVDAKGNPAPVPDWRCIPFSSRGALATGIRAAINTCPPVLVMHATPGSAAEVALEVLTPHAASIVWGVG